MTIILGTKTTEGTDEDGNTFILQSGQTVPISWPPKVDTTDLCITNLFYPTLDTTMTINDICSIQTTSEAEEMGWVTDFKDCAFCLDFGSLMLWKFFRQPNTGVFVVSYLAGLNETPCESNMHRLPLLATLALCEILLGVKLSGHRRMAMLAEDQS